MKIIKKRFAVLERRRKKRITDIFVFHENNTQYNHNEKRFL